ncbi:S8 family serine peptidase [Streptomyces sp. NPDC050392]|uniref:S8 family serine peptidase n=1 Tax=Streptomyces sp. NPDC050392 TaxID=3155782 RepID=UPI0034302A8E
MKKLLTLGVVAALAAAALPASAFAEGGPPPSSEPVHRVLTLTRPASVEAPAATARAAVGDQQDTVRAAAREAGITLTVEHSFHRLLNALSVTVPATQADRLASLPGVGSVSTPVTYQPPERPSPVPASVLAKAVADGARTLATSGDAPSGREVVTTTDLTGVPQAHRAGFTGKGVTVGILDSGIAYDHSAFGGGSFPNARVTGGYDFADDDPDPYDDASGPAFGHGTHVAGIIAGDDTHIEGVAPDAQLRAYRVFGEERPADEGLLIEALERAVGDGVDVINMSLGSTGGVRASGILARAVDNAVSAGVSVTVAEGNGYAGPFNTATPAVARKAIAVGSTYSNRYPYLALTLNDAQAEPLPYEDFGRTPPLPSTGSYPVVVGASSCAPLPAGSLTGKAVLFKAVNTIGCRPMDLLRVYERAGAAAGLYYQDAGDPDMIVGEPCCDTAGIPAVSLSLNSARRLLSAEDPTVTGGAYAGLGLDDAHAGLMDDGSSWGPGNELEFKPDVAAPGGYVLSSLPASAGSYGVLSGTSMAAPHVAGVAALLLQRDRRLSPSRVRSVLQTTATPVGLTGDPERGPEPVAHQGAGRVDAMAALRAVDGEQPYATTAELALGDLEGRAVPAEITVRNPSRTAVTYALSHRGALSAAPPYTDDWEVRDATASVTGLPRTVTVPARSSRTVHLRVRQPADVPDGTLLGGWIVLAPASGGNAVRVPYLAMSGDYDGVTAINPSFTAVNTGIDNPSLRPAYFDFGKNEPQTLDLGNGSTADDTVQVMVSHQFPLLKRMRLQVLDERGRTVATPYDERWITRNAGAGTGMDFHGWDGTRTNGSPAPAGTYRLRLVFDKALGDKDHASPTETWTSPEVTLVR